LGEDHSYNVHTLAVEVSGIVIVNLYKRPSDEMSDDTEQISFDIPPEGTKNVQIS
jgi:hypothetical protein